MKRIYIYQIYFPTNGKSYIGQTNNMKRRMSQHYSNDFIVGKALRKYTDWKVYILYTVKFRNEANRIEIEEIHNFNSLVPNGYNLTKGGEGGGDTWANCPNKEERKEKLRQSNSGKNHPMYGKHPSEETREKIRQATLGRISPMRGRHHSEETKAKIGKGNLGKKVSEESRAKMSIVKKGKKISKKHKAKIGAANKGNKHSEEAKAKISAASKGRKCSEETKAKMGIAQKKRFRENGITKETKAKMCNARLGKHHTEKSKAKMRKPKSDEHKANISIAAKARWQKENTNKK